MRGGAAVAWAALESSYGSPRVVTVSSPRQVTPLDALAPQGRQQV